MESVEAPIEYHISTKAVYVKEMFKQEHISGAGPNALFKNISLGWFVFMQGSHEAIGVGPDKPGIVAGDGIEITIRKRNNALPR